MANMSYCRFENTYGDFIDCDAAVQDFEELSESELGYARKLYNACESFISHFDEYTGYMEAHKDDEDDEDDDESWQ